jgi:hypothetical protein
MGHVKKQNAPRMPLRVIQVSIHSFVYVLNLIEMLAQVNWGQTLFPWAFNNSINDHGVKA